MSGLFGLSGIGDYLSNLFTPAQVPADMYNTGIYAGQYNPLGPIAKRLGAVASVAQDMPEKTARAAYDGATMFGDAANGNLQVMGPDGNVSQDAINRANGLALPLALGSAGAPPEANSLNMFIGRKSPLFDTDMAARASDMLAKGASRDDIWNATGSDRIAGTMFGPRGEPMQEISDQGARFKDPSAYAGKTDLTTGDVFNHPAGYEAYPQLANNEFNWRGSGSGTARGSYVRGDAPSGLPPTVSVSPRAPDPASTMLHENFTHGVQDIENWPKGGNTHMLNPGTPAWDIYQQRLKNVANGLSPEEFASRGLGDEDYTYADYLKQHEGALRDPQMRQLLDRSAQTSALEEAYKRSYGETQARNVQARMDMTLDQRKASPPWQTQDVPTDQQIPTYQSNGPENSLGPIFQRMRDNPDFDPRLLDEASPSPGQRHGLSKLTLKMPMGDVTAAYSPSGNVLQRQPFDFQSVPMGSHFFSLQGDSTAAGRSILGVNGKLFQNPVNQYGGSEFSLGPQQIHDQGYWAAAPGNAKTMNDQINRLLDQGPVLPTHVNMGPASGDFSGQTTQTLREMYNASNPSEAQRSAFNDAFNAQMQGGKKPVPGFDFNNMSDEALYRMTGNARAKVAKTMDTAPMQALGAPDVAAARMAVTEPQLFGKSGGTGFSISRMDNPGSILQWPLYPHPDYAGQMAGATYQGSVSPIPFQDFWQDFMKTRPPGETLQQSMYTQKLSPSTQKMTPQFLDHIMKVQENLQNLGWITRGGT